MPAVSPVILKRSHIKSISTRFLPFADAASDELPLGQLLRLSLFQVSVGMAIVLLNGTLNRVMVVELEVPVWLVSLMVSLPLLFAPLRALIGHRSDHHRCYLGWRRVPYLWMGTMAQFGGLAHDQRQRGHQENRAHEDKAVHQHQPAEFRQHPGAAVAQRGVRT